MIIFIFTKAVRKDSPVDKGTELRQIPDTAAQFLPDADAGGRGDLFPVPRMGTAGIGPEAGRMIFAVRPPGNQVFPDVPGIPVQHDGERPVKQTRPMGLLFCCRSGLPVQQIREDEPVVSRRIQRHVVFLFCHMFLLSDLYLICFCTPAMR